MKAPLFKKRSGIQSRAAQLVIICTLFALMATVCPKARASLWDGVPSTAGWLHTDWFGYWYPQGDYHLHAEHGWQYALGTSPTSIHLYDYRLDSWLWTSETTYPWMYAYGQPESWILYFRGASPGARWFYVSSSGTYRPESEWAQPVFTAGLAVNHPVTTAPGIPGTVTDPETGLVLGVPAGQSGSVSIAPLIEVPAAPFDGQGYAIEVDGLHDLVLQMDAATLDPDDRPLVYTYANMLGSFSDETGDRERWTPLPVEEDGSGGYRIYLPIPEPPVAVSSRSVGAAPRATAYEPPSHYWISSIKKTMPQSEQDMHVKLQISEYVDTLENVLSTGTRDVFRNRYRSIYLTLAYGPACYTPFNTLRAWSFGRQTRPVLSIRSATNPISLAHETAHYLHHMLVGDDAFDAFRSAGGSIFGTQHGIRDEIGRNNLLEDYAYFIESFLTGTGGNYYLERPHITFGGLYPTTRDFPGLEGFAASMLKALRQNTSEMKDYAGITRPIAPLNVDYARIFDVVAQGAQSVDALREACTNTLNPSEQAAFQVILGRTGWCYKIRGRLVDGDGQPIVGATVRNTQRINDELYEGGTSNVPSKADGSFVITGDVFGGSSLLEVSLNDDLVIEVPITVDWTLNTDDPVELGDIEVVERNAIFVREHHDYTHNEAFVPGFSLALDCNLEVEVTNADTAEVRSESEIFSDYNLTRMTIMLTAPVGSQLHISGSLSVTPSALGGSYPRNPSEDIIWSLKDHRMTTSPPDALTTTSETQVSVETTVNVSGGLSGTFYVSGNADFRTEDNGYLGRFTGLILVQVFGE